MQASAECQGKLGIDSVRRMATQIWIERIQSSVLPWGSAQMWWRSCKLMLRMLDGVDTKIKLGQMKLDTQPASRKLQEVDIERFDRGLWEALIKCLSACSRFRDEFESRCKPTLEEILHVLRSVRSEICQQVGKHSHLGHCLHNRNLREPSEGATVRGVIGSDLFRVRAL